MPSPGLPLANSPVLPVSHAHGPKPHVLHWCGLLLAALAWLPGPSLRGAEPANSAWLDLRPAAPGSGPQTAPIWVETLEPETRHWAADGSPSTVFRVRLRRPPGAGKDLQLRVFFQDAAEAVGRPRVTAWDELGHELLDSGPLGEGLDGLPTSQALTVPMRGVDYLEITAPGEGASVRGVFLAWLTRREIREPMDFPVATSAEPEQASELRLLTAARRRAEGGDGFLYGTVTAALHQGPATLRGTGPAGGNQPGGLLLEFELEKAPLVGLLTFDLLSDAAAGTPPEVFVNGQALGRADLLLPDLSDPAFQGTATQPPSDPRAALDPPAGALAFRYTGWLRAQRLVPAPLLVPGLNKLLIQLSKDGDSAAVRTVELQLKYPWEKLDYVVSPPAAGR